MNARTKVDADDLEALFDSIAAGREAADSAAPPPEPTPAPAPAPGEAGDADDLEALFDQVAAERAGEADPAPAPAAAPAAAGSEAPGEHLFVRVGQLTRTLHDALHELGYDKKIATAANSLPDARDRLAYIATLTGQAAERVLGAVEAEQEAQQRIRAERDDLGGRWERLYASELSVDEFRALAGDTRRFLDALAGHSERTNQRLHEIMMAQDFHDLTGQVIKRVVDLAGTLESSLVGLLIETQAAGSRPAEGWLSGPAVNADGNPDVVKNQEQVDSLLESLGF